MSIVQTIASIGRDHYRVVLQAGKNTIVGDEPIDKGGADEGMNPYEILAASLGACTCATLRMYADRKEMPLDGMIVTVTLERNEEINMTNLKRQIEFTGALTEAQTERLMQIADKCPVHKVLTNPIQIETTLKTQ